MKIFQLHKPRGASMRRMCPCYILHQSPCSLQNPESPEPYNQHPRTYLYKASAICTATRTF